MSYLVLGMLVGLVLGWLLAKTRIHSQAQHADNERLEKISQLEQSLAACRATAEAQLQTARNQLAELQQRITFLQNSEASTASSLSAANDQLSRSQARLDVANQTLASKSRELEQLREEQRDMQQVLSQSNQQGATFKANNEALGERLFALGKELEELKALRREMNQRDQELAVLKSNNKALLEKLDTQKKEMEVLGQKFNTEFENIVNKILDTKSEKFTELNRTNLKAILEPLGKNIADFKTKVEEVYDKESKERFSLGEKVRELAALNQLIGEEARNLTKALKGEAKTQGRWGEMILESILEKSGLQKGREYFMEYELMDADGKAQRSDSEGKKMRPDAVVKYPDNRNVIIDAKVSLNAFTRFVAATDAKEQQKELDSHVLAVKNHITILSAKGYDDYEKALDFVMMLIPNEPAYMAAMQGDPDLWNYAYDRRVLLQSPTNLITSLKLIVDLWKREYQNRNSMEIAERGAKLYDKFVGFVANLKDVGEHIEKAQKKYDEAYKQLKSGNDNLVLQATKLKDLGLKTKKTIPPEMINYEE